MRQRSASDSWSRRSIDVSLKFGAVITGVFGAVRVDHFSRFYHIESWVIVVTTVSSVIRIARFGLRIEIYLRRLMSVSSSRPVISVNLRADGSVSAGSWAAVSGHSQGRMPEVD